MTYTLDDINRLNRTKTAEEGKVYELRDGNQKFIGVIGGNVMVYVPQVSTQDGNFRTRAGTESIRVSKKKHQGCDILG